MSIENMLVFEEGWERKAYPDPISRGAPWTIGVGHTGAEVRGDTVWTDEQIKAALALDIKNCIVAAERRFAPWYFGLNEPRRAVLVGMMFQMGPERTGKFVNALRAMEERRFEDASKHMTASVWARQTPKRAIRMAEQMLSGEWNSLYLKPHGKG